MQLQRIEYQQPFVNPALGEMDRPYHVSPAPAPAPGISVFNQRVLGPAPERCGFTGPDNETYINRDTGEVLGTITDGSLEPGLVLSHISDRGGPAVNKGQIVSIQVGPQDTIIKKRFQHHQCKGGGERGEIVRLSKASQQRMLLNFRNVEGLRIMLTLTYPAEFPADGRIVKRDWAAMRKWLARRGIAGCWFLEFQQRGAPHIHCFIDNPVPAQKVASAWYKIVGSGDERHLRAGTRVEWLRCPATAAGSYAAKYSSKSEQKDVPEDFRNVGRFWGLFGGMKPAWRFLHSGKLSMPFVGLARIVRGVYKSMRKQAGYRPRRDNGVSGFIAWGVGAAALAPALE